MTTKHPQFRCTRLFAALAAAALAVAARAALADVPPANQAMLLLRILSYDRNVADRSGKEVTIAVLGKPGSSGSEAMQTAVAQALTDAASKSTVSGLPVRVVRLQYQNSGKLEQDLWNAKASAVYVAPDLGDAVPGLAKLAQKHRILTFAEGDGYIGNGLGVALVRRENRVAIVVNLPATKSEGADLDSALLRIAEVIR